MASEPKTIAVEPGSELDRLLDEASRRPLRFVRGDERFLLNLEAEEESIWAGYDPERARQGILVAAGSWAGIVDPEACKAYLRERRKTKNRPSVRWSAGVSSTRTG